MEYQSNYNSRLHSYTGTWDLVKDVHGLSKRIDVVMPSSVIYYTALGGVQNLVIVNNELFFKDTKHKFCDEQHVINALNTYYKKRSFFAESVSFDFEI